MCVVCHLSQDAVHSISKVIIGVPLLTLDAFILFKIKKTLDALYSPPVCATCRTMLVLTEQDYEDSDDDGVLAS
jgi:hypothetical protein